MEARRWGDLLVACAIAACVAGRGVVALTLSPNLPYRNCRDTNGRARGTSPAPGRYDGLNCDYFAYYSDDCGIQDSDFKARDMCCGCGGGETCFNTNNGANPSHDDNLSGDNVLPPGFESRGCLIYEEQPDLCAIYGRTGNGGTANRFQILYGGTGNGATGNPNESASIAAWRTSLDRTPNKSYYDDDDFRASEMCCVCGGGTTDPPTNEPTPVPSPMPTPAPTPRPVRAMQSPSC